MSHDHNHTHISFDPSKMKNAFYIGIVLNLLFVLVEVIYGFSIDSLSLISDAGHNFLDVLSLILSLFSFWLCQQKPTKNFTYGFKKSGILIALFNASVLLVSIGFILYNAILRFQNPVEMPGITMSVIAGIGVLINGISAYFFTKQGKRHQYKIGISAFTFRCGFVARHCYWRHCYLLYKLAFDRSDFEYFDLYRFVLQHLEFI